MNLVVPKPRPSVREKNQGVLDYVGGRLDENTSSVSCTLHINPCGEIRRIEWNSVEKSDDILSANGDGH